MAGNDFRFDSYQIYKQDARRSGNKFRYMYRYGMPYRKRFNSFILFSPFPLASTSKQYLAEAPPFPIYRAFRDHSPPNAAIPSSHAPRIPTFSACRVAASNRTRDRTNVSPLVQTNACSVRCSLGGRRTDHHNLADRESRVRPVFQYPAADLL